MIVPFAVAAVDEARPADGSNEDEQPDSVMGYGCPVSIHLAGLRENRVSNENAEVCVPPEKEDDGADADITNGETVERTSKAVGGNNSSIGDGSLLQERFCLTERPGTVGFVDNLGDKCADDAGTDVGVVRHRVDDPRRSRDPNKEGALDARRLTNRELPPKKNDESVTNVEGAAQGPMLNHGRGASREEEADVSVFNHGRGASREEKTERKYQGEREGRGATTFARGGHDGEEGGGDEEGEDDRVQWKDKEANEKKKGEEKEDGGGKEDTEYKEGKEEYKEDEEDGEDEEDKEEERVQTEEEQRASLETSVRLLRLVLASIIRSFRYFLLSTPQESFEKIGCYRAECEKINVAAGSSRVFLSSPISVK